MTHCPFSGRDSHRDSHLQPHISYWVSLVGPTVLFGLELSFPNLTGSLFVAELELLHLAVLEWLYIGFHDSGSRYNSPRLWSQVLDVKSCSELRQWLSSQKQYGKHVEGLLVPHSRRPDEPQSIKYWSFPSTVWCIPWLNHSLSLNMSKQTRSVHVTDRAMINARCTINACSRMDVKHLFLLHTNDVGSQVQGWRLNGHPMYVNYLCEFSVNTISLKNSILPMAIDVLLHLPPSMVG